MTDDGQRADLADEYREIAEAENEALSRYWAEKETIDAAYSDFWIRVRERGLSNSEIAELVNEVRGYDYANARSIGRVIRESDRAAGQGVEQFLDSVRVEAVMAERDVPEDEARAIVREEDRRRHEVQHAADRVRREADEATRRERVEALVEWTKAEGNGVYMDRTQAGMVLERVERLVRPNAATRRWVAGLMYGVPADSEEELPEGGPARVKALDAAREPMAARLIEFIRSQGRDA